MKEGVRKHVLLVLLVRVLNLLETIRVVCLFCLRFDFDPRVLKTLRGLSEIRSVSSYPH